MNFGWTVIQFNTQSTVTILILGVVCVCVVGGGGGGGGGVIKNSDHKSLIYCSLSQYLFDFETRQVSSWVFNLLISHFKQLFTRQLVRGEMKLNELKAEFSYQTHRVTSGGWILVICQPTFKLFYCFKFSLYISSKAIPSQII